VQRGDAKRGRHLRGTGFPDRACRCAGLYLHRPRRAEPATNEPWIRLPAGAHWCCHRDFCHRSTRGASGA
jgi:hypothetical protein